MWDLECPRCGTKFRDQPWEGGECPKCGNEYWWDEECTEDYEDCWAEIRWEHHVKTKEKP